MTGPDGPYFLTDPDGKVLAVICGTVLHPIATTLSGIRRDGPTGWEDTSEANLREALATTMSVAHLWLVGEEQDLADEALAVLTHVEEELRRRGLNEPDL